MSAEDARTITALPSGGGVAEDSGTGTERFVPPILALQLARLSETVRVVAENLPTRPTIPLLKEQASLIHAVVARGLVGDTT